MLKRFLNSKTLFIALETAFIFCFFTGIFWNPPIIIKQYDYNHRFYINRGYPVAWAGVSSIDKEVEFPIIKAPFLARDLFDNSRWVKIIDLRVFAPLFTGLFLISYILLFFVTEIIERSRYKNTILIPIYFILSLACVFFYYFWFPRI